MENMKEFKLIKQGAEARIYKGSYLGKVTIAKERFTKTYRIPTLDTDLTKKRIIAESRALVRCKAAGLRTPALYLVDFKRKTIFMEFIEHSQTVKDFIEEHSDRIEELSEFFFRIGKLLGTLHSNNIIHGDLTSSNILVVNRYAKDDFKNFNDLDLMPIDFGLSFIDSKTEEKGVDLYVLERALLSTHSVAEQLFPKILEGYKEEFKNGSQKILLKFEEVRARGRKRTMVG